MKLSDQEMLCLAKAINSNGKMKPGIIRNVYSSSVDVKSKLQTLEAKGLIRKTDKPALFMVRVDEDDKGAKWQVPSEVMKMAKNIRESKTNREKEEKILKKYREGKYVE